MIPLEISVREMMELDPQAVTLIDVREEDEPRPRTGLENWHWMSAPLSRFQGFVSSLDPQAAYVIVCLSGARSLAATDYLRRLGFRNVRSLAGGMDLVERQLSA